MAKRCRQAASRFRQAVSRVRKSTPCTRCLSLRTLYLLFCSPHQARRSTQKLQLRDQKLRLRNQKLRKFKKIITFQWSPGTHTGSPGTQESYGVINKEHRIKNSNPKSYGECVTSVNNLSSASSRCHDICNASVVSSVRRHPVIEGQIRGFIYIPVSGWNSDIVFNLPCHK